MSAGPRAGVLGLGIIGSRVAARLHAAGFPLAVWNRTPRTRDELPAPAADPAAVARQADILQIFVADDKALRTTVRSLLPVLGPTHVLASHATVAPETVRELAAAATPQHRILTTAMLDLYEQACDAGLGDEDFAAIIKVASSAPLKTEH